MTEAVKKEIKDAPFSVNPETGLVTATIGDTRVEVSADGNNVSIKQAANGHLIIATEGTIVINKATAAHAAAALVPGQQTEDGVYAGLTADGKQQIFAMPAILMEKIPPPSELNMFSGLSLDLNPL